MSRISLLNSPFLLGFEDVERLLDRVTKSSGDGYPPYNIEQIAHEEELPEGETASVIGDVIRITLAVAGFHKGQLEVFVEDNQLTIRGKQKDDKSQNYLHRGIAARQFSRSFVLAEGLDVVKATLENGLLSIDLVRPDPVKKIRKIDIIERETS